MTAADKDAFRVVLGENVLNHYNKGVFSAASVSLCYLSGENFQKKRITVEYNSKNKNLSDKAITVFDLASLTKPLVTLLCLLHLIDQGILNWSDRVKNVFQSGWSDSLSRVSIERLISHSSGLPAHRDYWEALSEVTPKWRKKWLLDKILQETVENPSYDCVVYSDLGYMLLGFIVETVTGQSLGTYWSTTIARTVGIEDDLFFPPGNRHEAKIYAGTGLCRWTGQQLAGKVHDDNCRLLGGVCGHAGLFGTSTAVLRLTEELLSLYSGKETVLPISRKTFLRACARVGQTDWSRGFQLPTPGKSSSGRYFSPESFGHLGFTGTSFWIDPVRQLIVVLLTNRVIKGEDRSAIQRMRPAVHDCIIEYLTGE
jgi:CubicO group peptidase (beta-lactamase class C family)